MPSPPASQEGGRWQRRPATAVRYGNGKTTGAAPRIPLPHSSLQGLPQSIAGSQLSAAQRGIAALRLARRLDVGRQILGLGNGYDVAAPGLQSRGQAESSAARGRVGGCGWRWRSLLATCLLSLPVACPRRSCTPLPLVVASCPSPRVPQASPPPPPPPPLNNCPRGAGCARPPCSSSPPTSGGTSTPIKMRPLKRERYASNASLGL